MRHATTILLVGLLSTGCGGTFRETALRERESAAWHGIQSSRAVLSTPGFPRASGVSAFIRSEAIQQALDGLKGARITPGSGGSAEHWHAKVEKVVLTPQYGSALVRIEARGIDSKGKPRLWLSIDGQLSVAGVDRDSVGQHAMRLDVMPLNVKPRVSFGWFRLMPPKSAQRFLADLSLLLAREKLSAVVPLGGRVDAALIPAAAADPRAQRNYTVPAEDWYVDTKLTATPVTLTRFLKFRAPAFVPAGVWLSFDIDRASGGRRTEVVTPPTTSGDRLARINVEGRAEIERLARNQQIQPAGSWVWINKSVLLDVFSAIDGLTDQERTITLQSTLRNGFITRSEWDHGILGKGLFSAALPSHTSVTGRGTIRSMRARWTAGSGITFQPSVELRVESPVHLHLDPNIGGGIGTTVGIRGQAGGDLSGSVQLAVEEVAGTKALLGHLDVACKALDIKLGTDGTFAWDVGWTKVPKLAVTFEQLIADQWLPPFLLLGDAPYVAKVGMPQARRDSTPFALNYEFALARVAPTNVSIESEGVSVPIDLTVTYTNDSVAVVRAEQRRRELQRALAGYHAGRQRRCPRSDRIAVHVGPLEFGPNNEIVKFIGNTWNDVVNGPGPNNDLVKAVNNVGTLLNAATPVDEALVNTFKQMTRTAERALGPNNEATKAIRNLAGEAEKLITKPGSTLGKAPSNILKEGKKAVCKVFGC